MAKSELLKIVRRDKTSGSYYTDGQIWLEQFDEELSNDKELLKTVLESVDCIGESVFSNLDIEEFIIPDNIKKLDYYVFFLNTRLKKVVIGKSIKHINNHCFKGCNKLANVVLQEGLERICDEAFRFCPSLTEITFPTTLKSIGDFAFMDTGIKEVKLPNGCKVSPTAFPADTKITFFSPKVEQEVDSEKDKKSKIIQGMIRDYEYRLKIDQSSVDKKTLNNYRENIQFLYDLAQRESETKEV